MSLRIAILGAGESGTGAALLARKLGQALWLSDGGPIQAAYRAVLESQAIPFEEGQHSEAYFREADLVVKSPGIPGSIPLLRALREAGKPIVSEIEYASRFTPAPLLAITGTNGKTTTTSLLHHLVKSAQPGAALGGNIGKSFAWLLAEGEAPCYVLEVSSFQLDDIAQFRPRVALLLNITPDHLDRYGTMDAYAAAKFRIAENQGPEDTFIYCHEDPETAARIGAYDIRAEVQGYGLAQKAGAAAWAEGSDICLAEGLRFDFGAMQLIGPHNQLNAMAAILAARAFGVPAETLRAALPHFAPVPHRLEPVGDWEGVRYINDSKATNVDATFYALQGMERPVVWMAGGVDKGNDYEALKPLVREKVKAIVVLGKYADKFRASFDKPLLQAASMEEGLALARQQAAPGDVVLLSPACASFDLFRNFEDRGDQFRAGVRNWILTEKTQ
jgi:UDP-N-acetylmuramoylalanine--D-glutamate ligase